MEKFVYGENELKIAKTQCGLCVYCNPEQENSCEKYVQKPAEVLEGKVKCPCLRTASILDL